MMFSWAKMIIAIFIGAPVVFRSDSSGEFKKIKKIRGDVQVKSCVIIHKFKHMFWWQLVLIYQLKLNFCWINCNQCFFNGYI